jgi:hypothetical protein
MAEAAPPANTPLVRTPFSIAGIAEDQTRIVAFPYFAKVTSAGTSPGSVEVVSPPETTLSAVSDEQAKEAGLPEGAVAVVGSVSYTVSGVTPGGSVNVTMQLPPGSEPTNVFKLINGSYIDVTSLATISGNTITLHLTDGGLGDADGVANGVIVDPVVPVRITKHAQTISFTSAAPVKPAIGGKYTAVATASSGLPVSFSIDGSSTAGACSVSVGTVSFTAVGICIIDASQAGSETYLPASQQQQTVEVVKASQTITFTSAPPSPALFGGTYTPSATGGASGNPVTFSIDSSSTAGACWILKGKISFIGSGSCVVDANQAGNANYNAAPKKQQSFSIGFSKTLSGGIGGSLTVSSGQAVYLSPGSTVGGSVTVQAGGALLAQGAKIGSWIHASGATAVRLCASRIGGALSITKTTGLIIAGDNDGVVACAGSKVGGAVGVSGNYGGVEFDANAVGGSLAISGNTGTLPPPDSGTVDAAGNKVGGHVQIQS